MFDARMGRGWIVIAVTAVIGLAAAPGCGSSDDGNASGQAQADRATSDNPTNAVVDDTSTGGSDRDQILAVLDGIQADFIAERARAYCAKLTDAGRRQIVAFGRPYGHTGGCVGVIAKLAAMTKQARVKQKPTKLLAVKVDGDQAVAKVSNGGRPPEAMAFVREDGEWRIPNPGFTNEAPPKKPKAVDLDKELEKLVRQQGD